MSEEAKQAQEKPATLDVLEKKVKSEEAESESTTEVETEAGESAKKVVPSPTDVTADVSVGNVTGGLKAREVVFFRQFWLFLVIFLLLPFGFILGPIILMTGDVYKAARDDHLFYPIQPLIKYILAIFAVIVQFGYVLLLLS